jgi:hypothetical protein
VTCQKNIAREQPVMHDEMMMKENRSLSKYAFVEVKPMHKTLNNDVTVLGLAGRAVLAPKPTLTPWHL